LIRSNKQELKLNKFEMRKQKKAYCFLKMLYNPLFIFSSLAVHIGLLIGVVTALALITLLLRK